MTKDEQIEAAYKAGRRAHDEGQGVSRFFTAYAHSKEQWTAFLKGYAEATTEENKRREGAR